MKISTIISSMGKRTFNSAKRIILQWKGELKQDVVEISSKIIQNNVAPNTPLYEKSYSFYKKFLNKKLFKLIDKQFLNVNKNINPINKNNIELCKNKITEFLDFCNDEEDVEIQKLTRKILHLKNPNKIFSFFKNGTINNIVERKLQRDGNAYMISEQIKTNKDLTPLHDIKYNEIRSNITKRYNELVMLFNKNSTNPEVLQIEQELKSMGIKNVNLSDDLKQAKLVKEAMQDLIATKIPLPHNISITPMSEDAMLGFGNNYMENNIPVRFIFLATSDEVAINSNKMSILDKIKKTFSFACLPIEYQQRYLKEVENSFLHRFSTANPKHIIYHEVRHTLERNSLKGLKLNETGRRITEGVSDYAKEDISEFKSEAFAKLMNGEKLTDEQMKLYMAFDGGIVPQF